MRKFLFSLPRKNFFDPANEDGVYKMEFVWHDCWKCPPEEVTNSGLTATDGKDIFEAFWYRPNGFMIKVRDKWVDINDYQKPWRWANSTDL